MKDLTLEKLLGSADEALRLNGKLELLTEILKFTVLNKDKIDFRDLFIDFIIAKQSELEREANEKR